MCVSPYNMQWNRSDEVCPNLVQDASGSGEGVDDVDDEAMGVPVEIHWPPRANRTWPSLAHVWSSWYREYLDADFPRLMVRFEDLLLRPSDVLHEIGHCVGASWRHPAREGQIQYVTDTVKNTTYFRKFLLDLFRSVT